MGLRFPKLGSMVFVTLVAFAVIGCALFGSSTEYISILGGKVRSIEVFLEGQDGKGLCPEQKYQLVIRATTSDGRQLETWRAPEEGESPVKTGFLDFSEFNFDFIAGKLDENGYFLSHPDALIAAGSGYKIFVTVKDDVNIFSKIHFETSLDCKASVDFAGSVGEEGAAGAAGAAEGENGPHGGPGGDGGYGGNGGEVEVTSAMVRTLYHPAAVLIKIQPKGGQPRHFLADPRSEDGFEIDCRGGDGGKGGKGGPGSAAGNGGKGGAGGVGGDGGVITGFFAFNQPLLQSFIKYLNEGGRPGDPGEGGEAGDRDSEGRPMYPGEVGNPGQLGDNGPLPDLRPEGAENLFDKLPEGVFLLSELWNPNTPPTPPVVAPPTMGPVPMPLSTSATPAPPAIPPAPSIPQPAPSTPPPAK